MQHNAIAYLKHRVSTHVQELSDFIIKNTRGPTSAPVIIKNLIRCHKNALYFNRWI